MKRAVTSTTSYWRIVYVKMWITRQLDIVSIIIVKMLPRRVRRWAARLHHEGV